MNIESIWIDQLPGTEFQKSVWKAIAAIPAGQTRTYAQIAASIGKPGAVRAVGGACHCNPLPVVIPCHRVVSKTGLGGYAYGADLKLALLTIEQSEKL